MAFNAASENEKAGLLIFQNETYYYFLCKSTENNSPVVHLFKAAHKAGENPELLASKKIKSTKELHLKIEAKGDNYAFYYAEKKNN